MKHLAFCEYCMKENLYKVYTTNKQSILKDENIKYIAKQAICEICDNEIFVPEIFDYNIESLYNEYRKKHNIILEREINNILIKYSIDKESLSLILGWHKGTIYRYLEGDMVSNSHSEVLKKIQSNPNYYSILLQTNKEKINPIIYNRSRQVVKEILNYNAPEEKMDAVIRYIIIRCEDFTKSGLQNLLYYVQAFSYVFTKKFIFKEDCEADLNGPIFRSILERYDRFGFEEVNQEILGNKSLELEDFERNIVESVIKFFSCYSGKVLKQMTNNEAPCVLTQLNSINKNKSGNYENNKVIKKNLIAEYFEGIKEKYNMINLLDIQKYSIDLFNKISI